MYYVAANLTHDGRAYRRGDTVESADISDENASVLLDMGVLSVRPIEAAQQQLAPAVEETPSPEPEVGGEPNASGEPSLDRTKDTSGTSEAKDVTPPTDTDPLPQAPEAAPKALEEMNRDELRKVAISEGIEADQVNGTFVSKATIIELINAKRNAGNSTPDTTQESNENSSQRDPSANL